MARLPEITPQLDERLTAEFLAHSLELLPFSLRQDAAMLDASALRFERPEPPRDPDLPLLPAKVYPRPQTALIEAVVRSLIPPPVVEGFVGRKTELDQAVLSLMGDRPAVITGERGAGKTALLRQIAHDSRIRKRFKRIWWLDDLDHAGVTIGLALNAPGVLRADPDDQPRLAREFLVAASTLLLIDNVEDDAALEWVLQCTPTAAVVVSRLDTPPIGTRVHLGGLPSDIGTELLARLADVPDTVIKALARQVDFRPGALGVIAALVTEDNISPDTIAEFLTDLADSAPEHQLAALYSASFEALPEQYQALCRAFAASPRRWIDGAAVQAAYNKPMVGQRALTFLERRRFIERRDNTVRIMGVWADSIPASESSGELEPFTSVVKPAARFDNEEETAELVAKGRALHDQGVTWIEEGRDEEAETALSQALNLRQVHDTDHAVAETLVALGRLAYLHGDDATAIRRLEAAAERLYTLRDEESLEIVRVALSRVYRRAGRLDAALSVLSDEAPPEDLTAVYRARQEWAEAIAVYEKWREHRPAWAQVGIAEVETLAGRYAEALAAIAETNTFEANWLRGMIYQAQGDAQKAQDVYMRIRAEVPSTHRAAFARAFAKALASTGEVHDAVMLVGAEGVWYESKLPRPIFARQRISQALFAHLNLMLGKAEEAEVIAGRALKITGERPDPEAEAMAHRVLARIAWQRGDLAQALTEFDAELTARGSMAKRDEHETGVTLHNMADVLCERGERDRAVANYRRALTHKDATHHPFSVLLTRLALRQILLDIGRHNDALEVGQEAVDMLLKRPDVDLQPLGYALVLQTQALIVQGRQGKASPIFDQWLSRLTSRTGEGIDHTHWGVRVLAIGLYLRSLFPLPTLAVDDPILLVDLAEQGVEASETHAPHTWPAWAARRDLGNVYLRLERWQDAIEVFEPLLLPADQGGPDTQAPFVTLAVHLGSGRAAVHLEQMDKAAQHYDAAQHFEPDPHARGLIVLELADSYRSIGDDENAAERYGEALRLLVQDRDVARYVDTVVTLAYTRLRLRRFSEAIETFEEALSVVEHLPQTDPGLTASVLFDMGTAHYTLGQYRRAAVVYKQSLEYQDQRQGPGRYVETLIALARSHKGAEAHQPALEAYHDALEFEILTQDQRRELLAEQAETFMRLDLTQAAIDSYRTALKIEGGSPVEMAALHRGLAAVYSSINDHDRARTHFQSALTFVQDEQTGLTLQALGDGYRAQGQPQGAITAYQKAIDQLNRAIYPVELAATQRALGEIYLEFGQAHEALTHLEAALELERALPQQDGGRIVLTLQRVAEAHEMRGELDLAIRRQHEALVYQDARHAPDGYVETLRVLGRLYAQLERYRDAVKAYEEALATESRQPKPDQDRVDDLTAALADAYRAQGRLEEAANLYRRVTRTQAQIHADMESANQSEQQPSERVPLREQVSQSLQSTEAEIARHLETLRAVEQSWALLNRVAKPDLKGLAFVRALQAQTSAALGRTEETDHYLNRLMQLLNSRRAELMLDDPRPIIRALALLVQGQEHEENQDYTAAHSAYQQALKLAEGDSKNDVALAWAIRQKAEKVAK